jgi:hypothetical protein
MAVYKISNEKQLNNLTSTFTNAGETSRVFTKNISSGNNNNNDIGTKVIDNNNADKIINEKEFAYNNQRPILFEKTFGNPNISNTSKQIRSSLIATAIRNNGYNLYTGKFIDGIGQDIYYLCPQNNNITTTKTPKISTFPKQTKSCYQLILENNFLNIPIIFNSQTSNLEQNGIYLKYREKKHLSNSTWNIIYVPSNLFETITITDPDGSTYIHLDLDYENILPDGEYDVSYDIATEITNDNN